MMTSSEVEPAFQKALVLLHSKAKDSAEQMKILVEDYLRSKTGKDIRIKLPVIPPTKLGSKYASATAEPENKRKAEKTDDLFDLPLSMRDAKRPKSDSKLESPTKRPTATEENDDLVSQILDFACLVCKGLDVSSGNQLVECHDCTALYHQECHKPVITDQEAMEFVCSSCVKKKLAQRSSGTSGSASSSSKSSKSESSSKTGSSSSSKDYKKSDREKSSSSKSSSSGSSRSGSSTYTESSKGSSKSSSSSSSNSSKSASSSLSATGSSFLQDADKRLQMLKKKAATKLQEKRKGK